MRSRAPLTLAVLLTLVAAGAAAELVRQAGAGRAELLVLLAVAVVVVGPPLVAACWVGLAAALLLLAPRPARPSYEEGPHGALPPLPRPLGLPPRVPAQAPGQQGETENF
jgi:MFS superfamily sulfate permease-like transporter